VSDLSRVPLPLRTGLELARFHEPQPATDGREAVFIKENSMNRKLVVAAFAAVTIAASAAPVAAQGFRHAWGWGGPSFGFGVGWGGYGYGWGGDYAYGAPWSGLDDWGYGYRPRYRYSAWGDPYGYDYGYSYPYGYGYGYSYPSYASYDCCYSDYYGGFYGGYGGYGGAYALVDNGYGRRGHRGDVGYRFSRGYNTGREYDIGRTGTHGTRSGGTMTGTSVNSRAGGSFGMARGSEVLSARIGGANVRATGGATVGAGAKRHEH
jgi:hypothetical protein